jgi:hypothetical protein
MMLVGSAPFYGEGGSDSDPTHAVMFDCIKRGAYEWPDDVLVSEEVCAPFFFPLPMFDCIKRGAYECLDNVLVSEESCALFFALSVFFSPLPIFFFYEWPDDVLVSEVCPYGLDIGVPLLYIHRCALIIYRCALIIYT